jgi:hypothetical protein
MNLWLAATIALLCASAGVALGWWFSRLRSPYWTIGFLIPLILVFAYALTFYIPAIIFVPPFSWIMMGIKKFATLGFVATLVLTTPLSRLPKVRDRIMIAVLMAVVVFSVSIWPFLAPMVDRKQLSRLRTSVDKDGICLQSTAYTCGPAAAVTALRKLRLPAEEGQIAILSCTSDLEGTPADMLADGLQNQFGKAGLMVKCRVFKNISELKGAGLTLAVVKYSLLEDHWVTVLEVTDSEVIVGDPLAGLTRLSYDQFRKQWRFIGIVLERKVPVGTGG